MLQNNEKDLNLNFGWRRYQENHALDKKTIKLIDISKKLFEKYSFGYMGSLESPSEDYREGRQMTGLGLIMHLAGDTRGPEEAIEEEFRKRGYDFKLGSNEDFKHRTAVIEEWNQIPSNLHEDPNLYLAISVHPDAFGAFKVDRREFNIKKRKDGKIISKFCLIDRTDKPGLAEPRLLYPFETGMFQDPVGARDALRLAAQYTHLAKD